MMWHVDGFNQTKIFGQIGCRKEANVSLSSGFMMLLAHQIYEDWLSFQLGTDACVFSSFMPSCIRTPMHSCMYICKWANIQYTSIHMCTLHIYMLAWVTCCCTRQHWPRGSQQSSCRLVRAVRLAELVPQARATSQIKNSGQALPHSDKWGLDSNPQTA